MQSHLTVTAVASGVAVFNNSATVRQNGCDIEVPPSRCPNTGLPFFGSIS